MSDQVWFIFGAYLIWYSLVVYINVVGRSAMGLSLKSDRFAIIPVLLLPLIGAALMYNGVT